MPPASAYDLFFFLLLLPLFVVIAQNNNGTISVGESLIAGDENAFWLSQSKDFALGFRQLEDGKFLVAIWYYKIQQDNIVWYANGDNPAPRGSKLELTADDGLVLSNDEGDMLWRPKLIPSSSPVKLGVMNDTGNFKLVAENSQVKWESFKNPTDTLLPTQVMELEGVLSSRKRPNDFSTGGYQFRLLGDGNAVLNRVNLPTRLAYDGAYYESRTSDNENITNSGQRVVFDESGYLYVELQSGVRFNITSPSDIVAFPASGYYHRITLSFHGVLSLSYYPKTSQSANSSWIKAKVEPENICRSVLNLGTTPCGYNSICSLAKDQTPTCRCPPEGYSLINSTDEYSGCKPDFLLVCDIATSSLGDEGKDDRVRLVPLPNINWQFGDYERIPSIEIEDCKDSCLKDCLCAAAVYNAPGKTCWKKRIPLSNGREEKLTYTTSFIKLSNVSTVPPDDKGFQKKESTNTLVIVLLSSLLGSSVFVNFVLIGAMCLALFLYSKKGFTLLGQNESPVKSNLRNFTYQELMNATNGFDKELGRGSCGIVYEGKTNQFGIVAVKLLDRMFQDNEKEFQVEVNVIGQTHHKNLLRLIGYCNEKQHRLLVYECMKNGTLASFLFGDLRPSWYQRIQIACGIARGLVYLHEECSTQIIHSDIKPQNVLLDESYNARISDFGLAKLLGLNQSHTKTNIRGTKGYVAPEWFRSAPISVKVDVYSFGVLLLEIICCRRNILKMDDEEGEKVILVDWACDCYVYGRLEALVESDSEAMCEIKMVERFVMVAIWCLQEDPSLRPTMKKALLMLEGIVQVSAPPHPSLSSSYTRAEDSPFSTSVRSIKY